ncbi:cobalamin biosynthesis protein [Paracoccus sp. (in: a-proteobacteria)]|uniref:cobalamin biosynthesis protein n=1 Tax=Paracoccus sp. TaxID=267 RepID=UPI00272DBDAB|nr:cobalamin biosynthesis protein [Paracoccus sp. (in: a-proteobacteria)]
MRIAGIGCRPGTTLPALLAALDAAGGADALATIHVREADLRPLARARALPLHLVDVTGIATPTRSPRILRAFGTGSVAEAAAIAAGGRLIHPRRTFGPPANAVTIAIAEVP